MCYLHLQGGKHSIEVIGQFLLPAALNLPVVYLTHIDFYCCGFLYSVLTCTVC